MNESETWKDVVDYEGLYKVSNKGNVYSVGRKDSRGQRCGGQMLKPSKHKDGYLHIGLSKSNTRKRKLIHRLVAEAFIPNPKGFLEINHIDEDKINNNAKNLEWCTREYNNTYGTRIERIVQKKSKKVRAVNVETGEVVTFNSTHDAGRKGYNTSAVSMACRELYKAGTGKLIGDGRTYRGHKWYYEEEK